MVSASSAIKAEEVKRVCGRTQSQFPKRGAIITPLIDDALEYNGVLERVQRLGSKVELMEHGQARQYRLHFSQTGNLQEDKIATNQHRSGGYKGR